MPTGPLGGYRPQADIHLEGFGGGGFGGGRNVRSRPSRILPSRRVRGPRQRYVEKMRKDASKAYEQRTAKERAAIIAGKPFQRVKGNNNANRLKGKMLERMSYLNQFKNMTAEDYFQ